MLVGNKQKWLPVEIELPKTRRRRGTGRTRTDSREVQEVNSRETGSSRRDTIRTEPGQNNREMGHESFPRDSARRPPREGRGNFRRARHEAPGEKHGSISQQSDETKTGTASADTEEGSRANRGWFIVIRCCYDIAS